MFSGICPDCGPTLLWEERILGVAQDEGGIHLRVRCWCGRELRVDTGRGRRARAAA
jgi:hypothetical protein